MTRNKDKAAQKRWKEQVRELLRQDRDLLKELVRIALRRALGTEMEEALEAGKREGTPSGLDYRSGQYHRSPTIGAGKIELKAAQGGVGKRFRTFR